MTTTIGEAVVIGRSPTALDTVLGDTTLVLSLETSISVELNRVGSEVWRLLESAKTFGDLTQDLTKKFAVDVELVKTEVSQLLTELQEHGLVTVGVGG